MKISENATRIIWAVCMVLIVGFLIFAYQAGTGKAFDEGIGGFDQFGNCYMYEGGTFFCQDKVVTPQPLNGSLMLGNATIIFINSKLILAPNTNGFLNISIGLPLIDNLSRSVGV